MMNGIESFANMILKEACRVQASDLHIVPRQKDVVVQLRIGKDLMTKYCIEKEFGEKLVSHFKFLASMDIGRGGSHKMVHCIYKWMDKKCICVFPRFQPYTKKVSLFVFIYKHLFSRYLIFRYFQVQRRNYFLLRYSHGLLVFTGPTGSGKTTTMYALLEVIRKENTSHRYTGRSS